MKRQVKLKGLNLKSIKKEPVLILTLTIDKKTITLERNLTDTFNIYKSIQLLRDLNGDDNITFTGFKDFNKLVKNTKIKRTSTIEYKDIEREYFNKFERPIMTEIIKKRIEERIKRAEKINGERVKNENKNFNNSK